MTQQPPQHGNGPWPQSPQSAQPDWHATVQRPQGQAQPPGSYQSAPGSYPSAPSSYPSAPGAYPSAPQPQPGPGQHQTGGYSPVTGQPAPYSGAQPYQPAFSTGPGQPGQPAGKRRSTGTVLLIILVGVLLAAGVGAAVGLLGGRDKGEPGGLQTSASPTPSPSPSQSSSEPTSTGPTTSSTPQLKEYEVGNGVIAHVPSNWKVTRQDPNKSLLQVTDEDDNTITIQTFGNQKACADLVNERLDTEQKRLTQQVRKPPKPLSMNPELNVCEGSVTGMRSGLSGTKKLFINIAASTRKTDKLGLSSILTMNTRSDTDRVLKDYNTITKSALNSQAEGS